MSFGEAIKTCFSKYADFSGRARRREFWFWALFTGIVGYAVSLLGGLIFGSDSSVVKIGQYVVALAFLLPGLAVSWRRMHDIGKPGALCLLGYASVILEVLASTFMYFALGDSTFLIISIVLELAGLAMTILLLVWTCRNSQPGDNKYGHNPKGEYF